MKSKIIITILMSITLISCSALKSSFEYTEGSNYLAEGDFPKAIDFLKRSVELDPTMSRNHANLANAYIQTGDWENAWYQARQAVLTTGANDIALVLFLHTYGQMVLSKNLNRVGTTYAEIKEALGEPDVCSQHGNAFSAQYGLCFMEFTEGKLSNLLIPNFP